MMSIENGSSASPLAHEPSRRTVVAVFVALMVVMVAGSLDQTIVSTALPTIAGDLDDMSHLLWITTAYVLASPCRYTASWATWSAERACS